MNAVIEEKKALRLAMHGARSQQKLASKTSYDLEICKRLEHIISARKAKVIHAYLPMGTEIDIRPLIQKLLKNNIMVVTPKTLPKRQLSHWVLHSLEDLEKGVFGTSYPANSSEYSGPFDLIIVPGLAFDADNYRMGYGGGYYDAFLAAHPSAYKIGILYPFQKVPKVPVESHDHPLNEILYIE